MQKRWIWPFELLEKIGEGGMGVVYRARYVVDDRQFAVKLLPADVASKTILSRFERELGILKTLRHPNIVHCFGGTCEGEQRFYAMELVEGGTLDRLVAQKGRLPWETAVDYALQMCSALAYAHERGVIHRDIKPGNFLMTDTGQLKLSDFGLATVHAASKITAAGKTMGTFPYMAPEQIRGKPPVSARTDLYALGCVLFELITGRPPFVGNAAVEVMHKHLRDDPPNAASFVKECPRELGELIIHMMAKDVTDRPVDAVAVAQKLRAISPSRRYEVGDLDDAVTRSLTRPASTPAKDGYRRRIEIPRNWLLPAGIAVVFFFLVWSMPWGSSGARESSLSSPAGKLWVQAFHHPSENVRIEAAKALGELGSQSSDPRAAEILMGGLSDQSDHVRRETIAALNKMGGTAKPAIAALIKAQKSDDSDVVRHEAAKAAQRIRDAEEPPPRSSLIPWLLWLLLIVGALVIAGRLGYLRRKPWTAWTRPHSGAIP